MLFLNDEGCDAIIGRTLRQLGHDVTFVAEVSPGKPDEDILAWGYAEQHIIITEDRDFSQLAFRDQKPAYGVIFVRIPDEQRLKKADRIAELLKAHANELAGAMTTLTLNRIKIRRLPTP